MEQLFSKTHAQYRPRRLLQYIFNGTSLDKYIFNANNLCSIAYLCQSDSIMYEIYLFQEKNPGAKKIHLTLSGPIFDQNMNFLKSSGFVVKQSFDEHTNAVSTKISAMTYQLLDSDFKFYSHTRFPFCEYSIGFNNPSLEYTLCASALTGHTEHVFNKPLLVSDMDYLKRLGFSIRSRSNFTLVSW